MNISLKVQFK